MYLKPLHQPLVFALRLKNNVVISKLVREIQFCTHRHWYSVVSISIYPGIQPFFSFRIAKFALMQQVLYLTLNMFEFVGGK